MFASEDSTVHVWDFKNDKLIAAYPDAKVLLNGLYILQGNRLFGTEQPQEKALKFEIPANRQMLFDNIVNYELVDFYCLSNLKGEFVLWNILETDFLVSFNGNEPNPNTYPGFTLKNNGFTLQFSSTVGNTLLRFSPIGQMNWVLSDDKGYFTSTPGAATSLSFKKGIDVLSLEQFDAKLNRPDLLFRNFPVADEKLLDSYRAAYTKRLNKMNLTEEQLVGDLKRPSISIVNRKELLLSTRTYNQKIGMQVQVSDEKELLEQVDVWVNDIPVFGVNGYDLRSRETKTADLQFEVSLRTGFNKVQVSAKNKSGTDSQKEELFFNVFSQPRETIVWSLVKAGLNLAGMPIHGSLRYQKYNLHIIGIGASKYLDSKMDLKYAEKDTRDITDLFSSAKKRKLKLKKILIDTLLNENVTVENVKKLKEKLLKGNPDDRVMVFYSGHGLLDVDFNYYLATHDTDFTNPKNGGLPYETLEWLLDGIPAQNKSIFMDACHSGELDEAVVAVDTTQAVTEDVSFRAFSSGNTKVNEKSTAFKMMKELFVDQRRGSGTTVVSSAGGAEYAQEGTQWGNGAFTYAFLKLGIEEMQADLDGNGEIMLSEMKKFLKTTVPYLTNGHQKPTSRQDNQEVDFRIW